MSKRKQTRAIHQAIYKLFRYLSKLVQTAALGFSQWLMRSFLILGRKQRRPANAKAGFVLPTVTLLLLVVSLVIGAILFRTGSRTNQVIGAREEQVIYNAATPAIERAKAKLEYLFLKDKRFPGGPPSDEMLLAMLTNKPEDYRGNSPTSLTYALPNNPYVFEDERQISGTDEGYINLNGGERDPAWAFRMDVDGDANGDPAKMETVVYSINLKRRHGNNITTEDSNIRDKAQNLVVRNGPITTTKINNPVCRSLTQNQNQNNNANSGQIRPTNESDWYPVGSAKLRKTFQVDAIVISNQNGLNRTVATLEFQQDRQLDRGNKWGAWFRYDLEISPGNPFNWNGAMYTAGNLIVGDPNFTAYLISARNSCFYTPDASEIKVNRDIKNNPTPEDPSFQGQFVSGKVGDDQFTGGSFMHVMKQQNDSPDTNQGNITFNGNTDSVKDGSQNGRPSDIALDPVLLFTQDQSQSRGSNKDNTQTTDSRFYTATANEGTIGYFNARKRLLSNSETAPFIDDSYRADDRYGPKPYYDKKGNAIKLDNSDKRNGANITDNNDKERLSKNNVDRLDTEYRTLGLDGYWERRAYASGLRVVVGERLELGNPFGWVNSDLNGNGNRNDAGETDPLYPATAGTHGDRQRRTLRDNLAAVQGTVVYQATPGDPPTAGEKPLACIATTAHPGTRETIRNSKNFQQVRNTYGLSSDFYSDFFTGLGTNGWEYTPPPQAANLRGGGAWGDALNNLANFAGDYQNPNDSGAFPPTQGSRVYPHPYLTMWGNFSNLKRAMSSDYNNSIADNSYLESAACTLGMLAHNIRYINETSLPSPPGLADRLKGLIVPSGSSTPANRIEITANSDLTLRTARVVINNTPVKTVPVSQLTPDDYISLLPAGDQPWARLVAMKLQIGRDRRFGFANAAPATATNYDPTASVTPPGTNTPDDEIPLAACEAGILPGGAGNEALELLCPLQPKFPSLYYLFPFNGHGREDGQPPAPNTEPYLRPVGTPTPPGANFIGFDAGKLAALAGDVKPRSEGEWILPITGSPLVRDDDFKIEAPGGDRWVSLIDNALYNGREFMTVRTLDIDLGQFKQANNPRTNDTWLPGSGVVYAFREDAVREDAISRPPTGGNCNTDAEIRSGGCLMNANTPSDPRVNSATGISPKPVDYFPDPDRRPHGFRLRNGRQIDRGSNNPRGLTFISDNPVYIQGDFNFHSTDGNSNNLQEFREQLDPNTDWTPNSFYDQRRNLDDRFARAATDTWRPAEILADAITILSDNFQEGSIDRGIRDGNPTESLDRRHSFRAMNGPTAAPPNGWVLENGLVIDTSTPASPPVPIKISRNGNLMSCSTSVALNQICPPAQQQEVTGSYRNPEADWNYRNVINQASDRMQVNATLISGIVPSRRNQTYGGFHNFPRFIEQWTQDRRSLISGSFVQLNFSTYATGPFEQNQWEPKTDEAPSSGGTPTRYIQYYAAPKRVWGYDVGLQYAPAGPVAQRFLQPPAQRSEFYRELPANDQYICRIRLALSRIRPELEQAARNECQQ